MGEEGLGWVLKALAGMEGPRWVYKGWDEC